MTHKFFASMTNISQIQDGYLPILGQNLMDITMILFYINLFYFFCLQFISHFVNTLKRHFEKGCCQLTQRIQKTFAKQCTCEGRLKMSRQNRTPSRNVITHGLRCIFIDTGVQLNDKN
ncbi:hypothetical protein FKM82_010426 [Ascaphus truei]